MGLGRENTLGAGKSFGNCKIRTAVDDHNLVPKLAAQFNHRRRIMTTAEKNERNRGSQPLAVTVS